MRLLATVCPTGPSVPTIKPKGRISRHPPHRNDGENAEMKMYLSKLKDLVPFMPKNRKLSKLEIIQHVIDYICDLQTELETNTEVNKCETTITTEDIALDCGNDNGAESRITLQHQQQNLKMFQSNEERLILVKNANTIDANPIMTTTIAAITPNATTAVTNLQQLLSPSIINHSSPAQRQPLIDRNTPNTILPANYNNTHSDINERAPQSLSPVALPSTTPLSHLLNGNCTSSSTCTDSIFINSYSNGIHTCRINNITNAVNTQNLTTVDNQKLDDKRMNHGKLYPV